MPIKSLAPFFWLETNSGRVTCRAWREPKGDANKYYIGKRDVGVTQLTIHRFRLTIFHSRTAIAVLGYHMRPASGTRARTRDRIDPNRDDGSGSTMSTTSISGPLLFGRTRAPTP